MRHSLEEKVALAALVGDQLADEDPDKIQEDKIRPIWTDDDLYTIKALVDVSGMKTKLQGTNTSANFGDEFVYAEAVIAALGCGRYEYRDFPEVLKGKYQCYTQADTTNLLAAGYDGGFTEMKDAVKEYVDFLETGGYFKYVE